jgi:hypothetical protein
MPPVNLREYLDWLIDAAEEEIEIDVPNLLGDMPLEQRQTLEALIRWVHVRVYVYNMVHDTDTSDG